MNFLLVFLTYFGRRLGRVWWQVTLISLLFCTPTDLASNFVESAFYDIAETPKFQIIKGLGDIVLYTIVWSFAGVVTMLIVRESELIQKEFRRPHFLVEELPDVLLVEETEPSNTSQEAWDLWRPRWSRLTKEGLFLWPRQLATLVLGMVMMSLGFLLMCIPGIFLGVKLAVMGPVLVREGAWGMRAVNLSFELTEGRFWKVFWLTVFGMTLYLAVVVPVILVVGVLGYFYPVLFALEFWFVTSVFEFPINLASSFFTVFYYCLYNFLLWDRAHQMEPRPVEDFLDFDPDEHLAGGSLAGSA